MRWPEEHAILVSLVSIAKGERTTAAWDAVAAQCSRLEAAAPDGWAGSQARQQALSVRRIMAREMAALA